MSHSAATDIRIGTILRETYELTSVLGKGGMGSVFLARHLRLPGKQVAVKVLLHSEDLSEEQYARFRREAEIASQLGHPNIIEVLDFHSLEDGTPYLVMEYLRGESLAQRLRKGRLSMREAFGIARQMGSALQAAHRAGVVHRDLKPANVFLVPNDSEGTVMERVKLLDFGISKLVGSQTLQTQDDILMGTPRYMSPEQAMGRNKEIDARTDIFALGCIVYEMLCGDSPFAGATIAEVIYRVVHEQPESLATRVPDLPARAVSAVERALAKNPKDRYPDVATFIAELTGTALQTLAMLGSDPTPLPPRGALRPASEPSIQDDQAGTDATFVPSRSGVAVAEAAQPQGASAEPSVEKGSTLAAFRASEPAPSQAGSSSVAPSQAGSPVSVSRRPTDLDVPALGPSAAQAAGPGTLPPQAPVPASASRSKLPVVLATVGGVALLTVAVVMAMRPGVMPPVDPPQPATSPPSSTSDTAKAEPGATPVAPPAQPSNPVGVATPDPTPANPTTPPANPTAENPTPPAANPGTPPRPGKPEKLPEEARKALATAERELADGNWQKAIRTVNATPQLKDTEAATLFMGRAYCRGKDQPNALRSLNNLKSSTLRAQLRAYCKKQDFEL
jgi:serine/threonine-protein kinase